MQVWALHPQTVVQAPGHAPRISSERESDETNHGHLVVDHQVVLTIQIVPPCRNFQVLCSINLCNNVEIVELGIGVPRHSCRIAAPHLPIRQRQTKTPAESQELHFVGTQGSTIGGVDNLPDECPSTQLGKPLKRRTQVTGPN